MARKKKIGRPLKHIPLTYDQLFEMAEVGATNKELAAIAGVTPDVLTARFKVAIEKGRLQGFISVKRNLYHMATKTKNLGAIIWFGKMFMGWREPPKQGEAEMIRDIHIIMSKVAPEVIGGNGVPRR